MQQITVDPALVLKLGQLPGQAVLCDSEGHALGFFSPFKDRPKLEDLQLEPPTSIAEIEERRKQGRTGKPLSEILKRLGLE
jgi:hypothetical protein